MWLPNEMRLDYFGFFNLSKNTRILCFQGSRIKLALNEFGFCVLEFIDVWPRDAGVYTCKATNSCGVDSIGCSISVMSK